MLYKYYIGLSLPPDIHEHIVNAQTKLHDPRTAIQPLEPHITLLPPPAVERIPPETLAAQAQAAAASYLPIAFTLKDIRSFDRRAVVIDVESQALHDLQSQLAKLVAVNTSTARASTRPFQPHVTLNQAIRGSRLPEGLLMRYREELAALLPQTCTVAKLTLYTWLKPRTYAARQL